MCIGLLTVMADFLGAIGSGTGMYTYYTSICYYIVCVVCYSSYILVLCRRVYCV